jgi:hypothetical protein
MGRERAKWWCLAAPKDRALAGAAILCSIAVSCVPGCVSGVRHAPRKLRTSLAEIEAVPITRPRQLD